MTSIKQREELHAAIWKIANDVRGAVDGWDFKQYVLGTLFYRFISEHFTDYVEAGNKSVNYAGRRDDEITPKIKDDITRAKGYFIYPSQLFVNVARTAGNNSALNTQLADIFSAIEGSAEGYDSENDIRGLFADFDTTSNRLGTTVAERNRRLAAVIRGVESLDFGDFAGHQIDLFGDAYEFLISNYAENEGILGGEFFTPQSVSKLIAHLALLGQKSVNKIYDPACGSGSLLLQAKKQFDEHLIEEGFYGQEINRTTYNLARMNMFLHGINYDKFSIALGDTLIDPQHDNEKPFDAIVSNPPYSVKWVGNADPTLINDPRFAPAGVLPPASKADFAFVLHALSYLSTKGRAAIICFPGIFYRGGAEQKIRRYLVEKNYVESVIALPPKLFFGTSIAVCVLVLSKHKADTTTRFIDASGEDFFRKETNNNVLSEEHIDRIVTLFDSRDAVEHVALSVDKSVIAENDFNLSVNTYVKAKDMRPKIDIAKLNKEVDQTIQRINELHKGINVDQGDREMKNIEKLLQEAETEVEWVTLGNAEFIEISNTSRRPPKTSKYKSGKIPYYGANNIQGYIDDYTHDGSYILVAEDGITNVENYSVQWATGKFWANNHVHVLRGINRVNNRFLFHYLRTVNFAPFLTGEILIRLTKENLLKIRIPVFPLSVQEKIVSMLDKFTELETNLERELDYRRQQYAYYRNLLLQEIRKSGGDSKKTFNQKKEIITIDNTDE